MPKLKARHTKLLPSNIVKPNHRLKIYKVFLFMRAYIIFYGAYKAFYEDRYSSSTTQITVFVIQ